MLLLSSCTSDPSPSHTYDPPAVTDEAEDTDLDIVDDDDSESSLLLSDMESELKFTEADSSPAVSLSAESAEAIRAHTDSMSREYSFCEFYETEEAYKRISDGFTRIKNHKFSALDKDGKLTAEHLFEIVKKNNTEYLKGENFEAEMSSKPKDKFVKEICTVIVDTVNTMSKKYPDIDWDRVNCNLGNLKIVNYAGMLAFAQVTEDLVMRVGEGNREMSTIATGGEDRYDDVIAHETMHVIQVGCVCEEIENCNRRCGIFKRYDDFETNTANIVWMFEGGAERSVCNLTGREPTTYTTMIGYLCSLDLACMIRDGVAPDAMETLAFYEDPERLFSLFECESGEEYTEIMNMLISIHVIQANDEGILNAYGEKYGIDMTNNDNEDHLYRLLKPEICRTMSKVFYRNLASLLSSGKQITANDLCYLINLFETSINTHLRFNDPEVAEINAGFTAEYKELRGKLFDAVNAECGVDMTALCEGYVLLCDEATVNASMKWNAPEKNKFMLDRTAYHGLNMEQRIH